ncbi:MAG: hypothetical protein K9L78_04655 [Victivallales bacterium]|nr:hypothetical protein [Victivallales bacterium]MCF7889393.1 hypothetical protein [Victivallales bacterium]
MKIKYFYFLFSLFLLLLLCGCNSSEYGSKKNSPFTQGNVQLTLKKNKTTQAEVLDKFGPPNVMTIDSDGNEVWTYQKNAMVTHSKKSGFYGSVILAGGESGAAGFEQTVRSMTLIIKFNEEKKVVGFKSMSTSF